MTSRISKIFHGGATRPLMITIILIASFAVYSNTLFNNFVYDDTDQVVKNPWITDVRHLPEIFTAPVWGFQNMGPTNYYRPMMHAIYMLTYYLFGLKPWGFHLVNLLFHTGVSVLIFLMASKLLVKYFPSTSNKSLLLPSFLASILFITDPIHTEAVAWVAGLPDLSFAFFYLLSFYFFMLYDEGFKAGYIISLVSFLFSCFSKEPALTLPVMLVVYDATFGTKRDKPMAIISRCIPYLVVAGFYMALRVHALKSFVPAETYSGVSSYQYVINIFPLFAEYLKDLLFPFNLNFWHRFLPINSLSGARGMLAVTVTAAFLAAVSASARKNRMIFVCLLFILVPLSPAFYIKGIGAKPYAERYLYLPSFGFVMLLALSFSWLSRKMPRQSLAIGLMGLALAGLYSKQTIERNFIWKNDLSLFTDTAKRCPDCEFPRGLLGNALLAAGRYDEAIEQFRVITLKLDPGSVQAYKSLGLAFARKGMLPEAITEYNRALSLDPTDAGARQSLGMLHTMNEHAQRGDGQDKEPGPAISGSARPYMDLAIGLEKKGKTDEAIEQYRKALTIEPGNAEIHYRIGNSYVQEGQVAAAIPHFKAAARLQPAEALYHNALGIAYARKGATDEAIGQFSTAVRLVPGEQAYRKNLEKATAMRNTKGKKR